MSSGSAYRRPLVARQFHRAHRQAALETLVARLSGQSADLLSYDEVVGKLRVAGQSPAGLRQIPVAAIVGSVGRYQDFTRTFLPRLESDEDRWVSVGAAAPVISDLPPIDVYKVGDAYFVLDGNHRVSIARLQGVAYIDANVTEVRTRVPLPPGARPDALIVAAEYGAFLEYTRLDLTRPGVDMSVSVPGQYVHLENHIEAYRFRVETEAGTEWAFDDAAAHWYDEAYLPLVQAIREQGILRYFPGRTETDFFVWLARHRLELQHELGWNISPDQAVSRLLSHARATERAAARPSRLRRLTRLVAPERPAPLPSWSSERTLARYSEHLFANVLLPITINEATGQMGLPVPAMRRAIKLSIDEGAQLCLLAVLDHSPPTSSEQAAIEAAREAVRRGKEALGLVGALDLETGNPTQRTIDLAFLNDLIVLDRHFNPATPDEAAPTAAARRIVTTAHRPLFIVEESDGAMPMQRALLVHDTRRAFDESLFIAAYLAERWKVALTVLPIGNGRNTAGVVARSQDYLAMHEVEPVYLSPVRASGGLAEVIVSTAAEVEADLIVLPGPGRGQNGVNQPDLTDTVMAVVRRWPRAVLIAS